MKNTIPIHNSGQPYVIAEIGSNHNGDMELAKKLIYEAKKSGASCVKFQSWNKNSIFSRKKYEDNYFLTDDYRDRNDFTLEEIVDRYSISEVELLEMKKYADEIDIDISSTPFSNKEADFLVEKLNAPFIKVASMDLNNYPFLDYLARKGKPMVISTGLSELYEIDKAVKTIENTGNKDLVILHCVSTYPPKDEEVNLNNIKTLQRIYPEYTIGFSDHTLGTVIPTAAAALGAFIIEKHFTLDKNLEGWDHKVSTTPSELKEMVENIWRVYNALGTYRIAATETEEKIIEFRRSIVLTRDMNEGETIKLEDLDYKRPGGGFDPEMTEFLVGRKLRRPLKFDHVLTRNDLV